MNIISNRNMRIVKSYVEGECLTYQELATKHNISRERVRQILTKNLELYQLIEIKKQNSKTRRDITTKANIGGVCKYCGKPKFEKRIYCGRECMTKARYTSPEDRKKKRSGHMKKYYSKNSDKINEKNKIWREQPEVKARLKKKARKKYLELRGNPKEWELHKLRIRTYYYKRKVRDCQDTGAKVEYEKILNNLIAEKRQREK